MPWNEPLQCRRHAQLGHHVLDAFDRLPERDTGRQIERQGDRRELPLVVDRKGFDLGREMGEGAQRDLRPAGAVDVDLR